ncbi:hypothetical protein AX15_007327 [Amanita polypyramis BW_CC]|nr:hypothetical protein AX15_007327 [Amanita polypyramis BW_CC]
MDPTTRLPPICSIASYSIQNLVGALEYLRNLYRPPVRGSRRRRRRHRRPSRTSVTKNSDAALTDYHLDSFERTYTLRWLTALISHLETRDTISEDTSETEGLIQSAASLLALCSGTAGAGAFHRDFVFASNYVSESYSVTVRVKDMPLNNHDYSSVGAQTWGGACVLSESIVDEPWKFGLCYMPQQTSLLCGHAPSATSYFTAVEKAVPRCQPLRILELGAGTGLVSLTVGKLLETLISSYHTASPVSSDNPFPIVSPPAISPPLNANDRPIPVSKAATVIATDYYPPVLENLASNMTLNFPSNNELDKDRAITVVPYPLDWSLFSSTYTLSDNTASPALPKPFDEPFDIIFGADIIYELEHASWIKSCLSVLLRKPNHTFSLEGEYMPLTGDTSLEPAFHLVIPLRATHAKESRTLELVFPFSKESFEEGGGCEHDHVDYSVRDAGINELKLCILSKEVVVCETGDDDTNSSSEFDDGEGGRIFSRLSCAAVPSMVSERLRLGVIFWLFAVHLAGIYLFTRGFLLSRLSLANHSSCHPPNPNCTLPPTHKRAVLLVIDSLRFDFVTPHPPQPPSQHHHNVLTLPRELTAQRPAHSFLFNAYADPPTTTLQRIKGLATGSLPTFIDMGNNFGGSSISEDSILKQVRLAGKTSTFMGDDTWMSVFPDEFHPNMTFPYDSFNVEDLHTVDEGVITHLFPLLKDPSKPFDFLVGHFLGVDHVGHRVGPDHPSMKTKLLQMNDVLKQVVEDIDDETLLIVLGDHGMDRSGDHGGDGVFETSAALWIYSKGPALTSTVSTPPSGLLQFKTFPGTTIRHRSIQQIDILPTISLLLGLPIPYNNLGSVVPEIFWRAGNGDDLKRALEINADQIRRYLDTYRSSPSGGELDYSWNHIQNAWDATKSVLNLRDMYLVTLNNFNRAALDSCRSMWAQFDPMLMGFGLAVLCTGILSAWFVYAALEKAHNDWHDWLKVHMPHGILGAGIGAILGWIVHYWIAAVVPGIRASDWIIFFASLCSCLAFIITTTPPSVNLKSFPVILTLHTVAFFSNSFTFWEDRIIPFLLATSVLVNFALHGITAPTSHLRRRILGFSALFLVCIRLISISTICREEQQPYCHVTFFASSSLPSPPILVLILALPMAAIVMPLSIQRVLRITRSEKGIASTFLSIIVPPSLVASTLFWIVEWADSNHIFGDSGEYGEPSAAVLRGVRSWLARFALGWPLLAGLGLWWLVPLCLHIQVDNAQTGDDDSQTGSELTGTKEVPKPKRQVTVLGYANAFGAPYLMFWTILFCVVYASVQLTAQIVLGLATVALLAYLEVVDSVRDVRSIESALASGTPSSILNGPPASTPSLGPAPGTQLRFSDVVPIALLGLLTFYATGHQATVSSIQWKAAFLLTETVKYPWSPFTLACNFLGSIAVFAGFGAPLVASWNRAPSMGADEDGYQQNHDPKQATEGAVITRPTRERYDAQVKADSTLAALGIMMYFGTLLLGTTMSAAILRRHLMVWKVFAPRFMAAVVHLLAVDVGVLVGVGVGVERVAERMGIVFKGVVRE